jgi:hypothetical protein
MVPRETMNLGQYVADLISAANEIQKASASDKDCMRIYQLALEARDSASLIRAWAYEKMSAGAQQSD